MRFKEWWQNFHFWVKCPFNNVWWCGSGDAMAHKTHYSIICFHCWNFLWKNPEGLSTKPHLSIKTVRSHGNCVIDCSCQCPCFFPPGHLYRYGRRGNIKLRLINAKGFSQNSQYKYNQRGHKAFDWQGLHEAREFWGIKMTWLRTVPPLTLVQTRDTHSRPKNGTRRIPRKNLQSARWHHKCSEGPGVTSLWLPPVGPLLADLSDTQHWRDIRERLSHSEKKKNPDLLQALLDSGQWMGFC